jgi:hypothetical protein
MLHPVTPSRRYDPDTIAVMTTTFDQVCRCLSARMSDNEDIKRTLATAILRLVDQGERDPTLLADAAFHELAGTQRSAAGPGRGGGARQ